MGAGAELEPVPGSCYRVLIRPQHLAAIAINIRARQEPTVRGGRPVAGAVEVFEPAPMLEYLPVCDAPDLMAHHGCPPRGGRDVRERAEVGAAGDDAGHDLVLLGEHVRDDHVDVREGPVQADDGGKVVTIPLVPRTARATAIAAALRCPPGGRAGHYGGRNLPNGFARAPVPGPTVDT